MDLKNTVKSSPLVLYSPRSHNCQWQSYDFEVRALFLQWILRKKEEHTIIMIRLCAARQRKGDVTQYKMGGGQRHTVATKVGMTTELLKKCVTSCSWATVLVKDSNFLEQIGQHKGRKMPRKIEEKLVTTHRSVAILHTILVYIAN